MAMCMIWVCHSSYTSCVFHTRSGCRLKMYMHVARPPNSNKNKGKLTQWCKPENKICRIERVFLSTKTFCWYPITYGYLTHKPRAVTMKLWEPKRKCPKAVPRHLQTHAMWSRTLQCNVKSYVTGPSTKCYFNECQGTQVLTHDKIE